MPILKTLTVNNGTADVAYNPAASSATTATFINRGGSLKGISRITNNHPIPGVNASVQRHSLVLDKQKEVEVNGVLTVQRIALFDLGVAQDVNATRTDRESALNELTSLLADADVRKSIIDNEPWFGS